jgi:hypothetical protein
LKIVEVIDERIYKLDERICPTIIDFNHWQKSIDIHLIKNLKIDCNLKIKYKLEIEDVVDKFKHQTQFKDHHLFCTLVSYGW